MTARQLLGAGAAIWAAVQLSVFIGAQGEDVKARYERAESFGRRTTGRVYNLVDRVAWLPDSDAVTYRKTVKGGYAFVLVDTATGTKADAFDHERLAAALSTAMGNQYTAATLPFAAFEFADGRRGIEFTANGAPAPAPQARWRCTLADYVCSRQAAPPPADAGSPAPGGTGRGGAPNTQPRVSPDGRFEASIRNYNVYVRPVQPSGRSGGDAAASSGFSLSSDGSEGNAYTLQSIRWSPDSKKIAAFRRRPGYERLVHLVESSPTDQLQPRHRTLAYRKPGDVVDFDQPVVFDIGTRAALAGDVSLFPNPYENTRLAWRNDSRAVTFEYNQRGHQAYRVLEIDAMTGRTRTLIEETQKTFVEYSGKRHRYDVADGKEIVWASERDGWNHLYLYDGTTGVVKNQITKGPWVVRGVDRVDEQARQIWFRASGMTPGQDPYLVKYYRVNFDGTGLTAFTPEDGQHGAPQYSPDRRYYVDTWSRVDLPPRTVLKRTSDQSVVMPLETADITDLLATGWRLPEVFTAKGRDGVTDIWGIIIRPTNFDPAHSYPVVENIYAGPQDSFVPKTFGTQGGMQSLAELGFIVVQIDGMGTSNRSKAFHDVAWQNLGDAGFPDRILWHRAVAATYPRNYDITRVGIYGTSAGGQNSAGALLFHPEFYTVAYSNSGCHDNRMDKIWWNEQWMGWPLGPHYAASSNVEHASRLKGRLMLVVPELDTNVDPSSTLQLANALVRANKTFELVFVPGASHGAGGPFTTRKRNDWFVKHLLGLDPPDWNAEPESSARNDAARAAFEPETDYDALERAAFFADDLD
ncbi:MAG TPA: DPP IV N-terminal domain-containing protein [Vicinamibacterales bacterium]|nr:DPP IV N-terminal domain-containing protein [Vicinamibacterales bacterium]